jgi:hypothetical protein
MTRAQAAWLRRNTDVDATDLPENQPTGHVHQLPVKRRINYTTIFLAAGLVVWVARMIFTR